jgi:hypothetical protein
VARPDGHHAAVEPFGLHHAEVVLGLRARRMGHGQEQEQQFERSEFHVLVEIVTYCLMYRTGMGLICLHQWCNKSLVTYNDLSVEGKQEEDVHGVCHILFLVLRPPCSSRRTSP